MPEPRRRGPAFKQRDLERAIRAVERAGLKDFRIEIEKDGKIVIMAAREADAAREVERWDEALSSG